MEDIRPRYYQYILGKNHHQTINKIALYKNILSDKLEAFKEKRLEEINTKAKYFNEYNKKLNKQQEEFVKKNKLLYYRPNPVLVLKYELYSKTGFTNAWQKMYEICRTNNFIPDQARIRHLDLCGLPGAFVLAINHYIKQYNPDINYDWYIQSMRPGKGEYFKDEYKIVKNYPERFLVKDKGDITSLVERNYLTQYFENDKCDIVTSDCGLNPDLYLRDKQMMKTFLSQYQTGTNCLKIGGNFLMKFYNFYSSLPLSLVYIMCCQFREVKLIKPETSHQFYGQEIYLLCSGFNGQIINFNEVIAKYNLDNVNYSLLPTKNIDKKLLDNIIKKLERYYLIIEKNKNRRIEWIHKNIKVWPEEDYEEYKKTIMKLLPKDKRINDNYYRNYYKRMGYKKINKEDKLV
jgi:hypothetical protein